MDKYIEKLIGKFGTFVFPKLKTIYEPTKEDQQLKMMIPNYRIPTTNPENKNSSNNSDLTYKIVKTADNNLSIFKKNDNNILPQESVDEKLHHVERKNRKSSIMDAVDDLKYQVMKRNNEQSRMDGRVDSVILKRKAESPSPNNENRKKMKLSARRKSTPIVNIPCSKNVVENVSTDQQKTINTKSNDDELMKAETEKRIEPKPSSKSTETPPKEVASKLKEGMISAIAKSLDKLKTSVSTDDNSKSSSIDSGIHSNKTPEHEVTIEKITSNNTVGNLITVLPQQKEPSTPNPVIPTNDKNRNDKNRNDGDINLPVPRLDRPPIDSKKEFQMRATISNRQGSMSGSSTSQSVGGSSDDLFEMSIKSEPLSDDERANRLPNEDSSELIILPLDNRSQNGAHESNFSKITVKNISTMTKPLPKPRVAARKVPMGQSGK